MTKSVVAKLVLALVSAFIASPVLLAQVSPDAAIGINAGFARLFGSVNGFTATADVQVLDATKQETLRTPMGFAYLKNKLRMDIDMAQMKGRSVPPDVVNSFKRAGMDRIVSIVRLDQKTMCLMFSSAKSYSSFDMSKAEAAVAEKNVQVQRTLLGKETVDGRACNKNKVVVKSGKGATLLEATTWNATDLKDFPVQVQLQAPDKTTVVRFAQIQMTPPAASQFDPPAGYTKYPTPESMAISIAHNYEAAQAAAAARKPAAAAPAKTPEKKSAAKKTK